MPLLKWALDHGADTNIGRPTNQEETDKYFPLADAWSEQSIDLLLKHGAEIDDSGALAHFARYEQLKLLKVLLARGAKPSDLALVHASHAKYTAIVKLLLDAGAKPESKDSLVLWGVEDLEIATMLIDAGFPVNVHQNDQRYQDPGGTPLHIAALAGNLEMVRLLIARGAKVDATRKNTETPLFYAVGNRTTDMVNLLLDAGANINHLNEKNESVLFAALETQNLPVLKLLIERGADVTIEDRYHRTALHYAEDYAEKTSFGNQEGIDILKAAALAKKPKK